MHNFTYLILGAFNSVLFDLLSYLVAKGPLINVCFIVSTQTD